MVVREREFLSDAAEDAVYWLNYHQFPDGSFGKSGSSYKDLIPSSSSPYYKHYLEQEVFDCVQVPRLISIVQDNLISMAGDPWYLQEDKKYQQWEMESQATGHSLCEVDQDNL